MAISDINRAMAAYSQPSEFDRTAWKTAYDIANGLTGAENNRITANRNQLGYVNALRQYQNALQTDPSSIEATVAQNLYNQANYGINTETLQGADELAKAQARYAYDPTGRLRNPEEIAQLAYQNNALQSPYGKLAAHQQLAQYYANQANALAPFNPETASIYGYQGGKPYLYEQGNLVTPDGKMIAENPAVDQVQSLYTVPADSKYAQALELAQLRNDYTLGQIQARGELGQAKQENWANHRNTEADWKIASGYIDQAFSTANGDQKILSTQIGALVNAYPNLKEQIGKAVQIRLAQAQATPTN